MMFEGLCVITVSIEKTSVEATIFVKFKIAKSSSFCFLLLSAAVCVGLTVPAVNKRLLTNRTSEVKLQEVQLISVSVLQAFFFRFGFVTVIGAFSGTFYRKISLLFDSPRREKTKQTTETI